jgi:hydrogenase nickel incorporation protein HypA/HybF
MHEMGIILHLAKTLEETAEQEKIGKITRVTLEVGEVSGILTDYFVECWNYFRRKHPVLETAELELETIPAVTWCDACKRTYPTVRYGRTCPYCQSGETWLLKGNECIIKEIEVEDGEPQNAAPESE